MTKTSNTFKLDKRTECNGLCPCCCELIGVEVTKDMTLEEAEAKHLKEMGF